MKDIKLYMIAGVIFVSALGTFLHFAYELSQNSFIVGLFTPINESIWEHAKLIFYPMLIYSLFLNKRLKNEYPCIRSSMNFATLLGVVLIIVLFYLYSGIIGFNVSFVDISIFYISVIASFFVGYKLTLSCSIDKFNLILQILIIIMILLFTIFTLYPPHIPLFTSP